MSVGGENLSGLIAKSACFCLNEDSGHPYSNLFVGDHTLFLQSDTDEQLIIHIGFNQTVSLKHIYLGLPADESCPATVKLFINQPSLGFSDASEIPPTQVLSLSPPSIPEVISHPLSAAKWQRVDSITIFVEDNHGAPASVLHALKFFGTQVHGTNVSAIHQ